MATVGIVGLGLLGGAVASRLRAGGHDVVGYDIAADKVTALVALGGRAAPSAQAVAESAAAVCVVLPSLTSVEDVVLGPRGLAASGAAGATIIQMSTISPALTERLAREVTAKGLAFLDCPRESSSSAATRASSGVGARCWRPSCRAPSSSAAPARRWSSSSWPISWSRSTARRPPRPS